jgi:hypothetical protein
MEKMQPCCARLQTALVREEGELRRVARMANRRSGKGLSTAKEQARIAEIKTAIRVIKGNIEDHDADHSGEMC